MKNPFKLPTPKELGWSEHNALPIYLFSEDKPDGKYKKTWEDYDKEMKRLYPIRFFILKVLPTYFWAPKRYLKEAIYWLKCHLISKHKYHLLDLRQPKLKNGKPNPEYYNYGWIDSDKKVVYALFNILNEFMLHEFDNFYVPPEAEIEENANDTGDLLTDQRNAGLEMQALHKWWSEDRPRKLQDAEEILHTWHEARKERRPDANIWWKKLNEIEAYNDAQEEEMIARLLKIRKWLWT